MGELTPMMRKYLEIKEQNKDCLLFFRLGDFYEMFFEDAQLASRELELTLTGRDCGLEERAPMCGVPHHAVDTYVNRLIKRGYKVAICEQLEDPATAKGMVKRGVVRIITPGTVVENTMLEARENNYLCCACAIGSELGIAYVDVSTGDFHVGVLSGDPSKLLIEELCRIQPGELLLNAQAQILFETFTDRSAMIRTTVTPLPDMYFQDDMALPRIRAQFAQAQLETAQKPALSAGGALLCYLSRTQMIAMEQINHLNVYQRSAYMLLDASTRRNLELTETMRERKTQGTLLWVLDKTMTAMGARGLKQWIHQPLQDIAAINRRLDGVQALLEDMPLRVDVQTDLKGVYDIERLATKVVYGSVNPRDCLSVAQSARKTAAIKERLVLSESSLMQSIAKALDTLSDIADLVEAAIDPEAGIAMKDGGYIRHGYNAQLDAYRNASLQGATWLKELEANEREATGIKNLKVSYNRVFGYYIEVTKSNLDLVPYRYQRKQTLADKERYITQELKEIEDQILGANDKAMALENELFQEVRMVLKAAVERLQDTARTLAQLDVLQSLATVAMEQGYVRPVITKDCVLHIEEGRHPVVDKVLSKGMFVPNSTHMDTEDNRLAVLTGPNMAGKSTYLRQVALIALMAHMGSFVPAQSATVGMIDRIFTRVGASDDLAMGQSTFMLEMMEMSNILRDAGERSLLILDEIGRGTSTFDGLSIAWSAVEYIADKQKLGAKTIFATHYHELTELEGKLDGVRNYCLSVKQHGEDVIFLRKVIRGGASRSFGVEVAKMAGLPDALIKRAKQIMRQLEKADINNAAIGKEILQDSNTVQSEQLGMFQYHTVELVERLKQLDVDSMTPLEALNALDRICREAKNL